MTILACLYQLKMKKNIVFQAINREIILKLNYFQCFFFILNFPFIFPCIKLIQKWNVQTNLSLIFCPLVLLHLKTVFFNWKNKIFGISPYSNEILPPPPYFHEKISWRFVFHISRHYMALLHCRTLSQLCGAFQNST